MPDIKYCEYTEDEIRKAFFSGKLNKLLDDISATGKCTVEEVKRLEGFLAYLQEEKRENERKTAKLYGEIEPPSVNELMKMTDDQKVAIEKWIEDCKPTMAEMQRIMQQANNAVKAKQPIKLNEWLNYGLSVITLMFSLDQYEIVHEQLYRAKLTSFIDGYGMSRAEADERAKLTKEYREYKKAQRLKENILEFEMMCKKYAGIQ